MADAKKCDICAGYYDSPTKSDYSITKDGKEFDRCPKCEKTVEHVLNPGRPYKKRKDAGVSRREDVGQEKKGRGKHEWTQEQKDAQAERKRDWWKTRKGDYKKPGKASTRNYKNLPSEEKVRKSHPGLTQEQKEAQSKRMKKWWDENPQKKKRGPYGRGFKRKSQSEENKFRAGKEQTTGRRGRPPLELKHPPEEMVVKIEEETHQKREPPPYTGKPRGRPPKDKVNNQGLDLGLDLEKETTKQRKKPGPIPKKRVLPPPETMVKSDDQAKMDSWKKELKDVPLAKAVEELSEEDEYGEDIKEKEEGNS